MIFELSIIILYKIGDEVGSAGSRPTYGADYAHCCHPWPAADHSSHNRRQSAVGRACRHRTNRGQPALLWQAGTPDCLFRAKSLPAQSSGHNLKLICQSDPPYHIQKDEFCHGRAANIAVAHEQNAYRPVRYAHSASLAKMASAASAVGAVSEKLLSRAVSSTTPFFRFRGLTITRRGTPSRSASENITPALTERSS